MTQERHIINHLKSITEQIKSIKDSDNEEYFKIKAENECCPNVCNLLNTYIAAKRNRLDFINNQINEINNISVSFRPDTIESWIGKANSEAKKLKNQLLFKIKEAELIKTKTPCNCD